MHHPPLVVLGNDGEEVQQLADVLPSLLCRAAATGSTHFRNMSRVITPVRLCSDSLSLTKR